MARSSASSTRRPCSRRSPARAASHGVRPRSAGRRDPRAAPLVARALRGARPGRARDGRRVPRLEEHAALAGLARLELARRLPRPLPDVALEQPERAEPELRLRHLQRLRELPRRPRLLVYLVLREPD